MGLEMQKLVKSRAKLICCVVCLVFILLMVYRFDGSKRRERGDFWEYKQNPTVEAVVDAYEPQYLMFVTVAALAVALVTYFIVSSRGGRLCVTCVSCSCCLCIVIYILTSQRTHSMMNPQYTRLYSPIPPSLMSSSMRLESLSTSETIGFTTGGAGDISTFRNNIKNGYLPQITDITPEGIFSDYYFDTSPSPFSKADECQSLFCPTFSFGVSSDPITKNMNEYFLSIGLTSSMKKSDFSRKKLNLAVVLDVSGSMSSSFNSYYYDGKNGEEKETERSNKSKMQIATEVIVDLIQHLNDEDRIGIILFDHNSYIGMEFHRIEDIEISSLKEHILSLSPQGGTNFEAGYNSATKLFKSLSDSDMDMSEYESRIIFLTDAMPNIGSTNENQLLGLMKSNSDRQKRNIFTTFVGIGVDFNTALINFISRTSGCNYFSVTSEKQFKKRVDEEFEYWVSPLVFDLEIEIDLSSSNNDLKVDKIYGAPESRVKLCNDEKSKMSYTIGTLFPAKKDDKGETKGGVILVKLSGISSLLSDSSSTNERIVAKYKNRRGEEKEVEIKIPFRDIFMNLRKESQGSESENHMFENTGIRKAVLLTRFVSLMKFWIHCSRGFIKSDQHVFGEKEEGSILSYWEEISDGDDEKVFRDRSYISQWERTSLKKEKVTDLMKQILERFVDYFGVERVRIGDKELEKEEKLIKDLLMKF